MFKASLLKKGYFRECAPGSDAYRERDDGAKRYYLQSVRRGNGGRDGGGAVLCVEGGVSPDDVHSFCLKVMDSAERKEDGNEGTGFREHHHSGMVVDSWILSDCGLERMQFLRECALNGVGGHGVD